MDPGASDVTVLLQAWGAGDETARHSLTALLLQELRRVARRYKRDEHNAGTLQTTALVNEVYVRLAQVRDVDWQRRGQFFALIAQLVRHVLVDAARTRAARKHGSSLERVDLDPAELAAAQPEQIILALHEALEEFARAAPRQAKVVELRYFGGLSEEETATLLETSARTIRRDWQFAKAWLTRALSTASRL